MLWMLLNPDHGSREHMLFVLMSDVFSVSCNRNPEQPLCTRCGCASQHSNPGS
jgi:hypothetical protein